LTILPPVISIAIQPPQGKRAYAPIVSPEHP
jgi:hypothetical protein